MSQLPGISPSAEGQNPLPKPEEVEVVVNVRYETGTVDLVITKQRVAVRDGRLALVGVPVEVRVALPLALGLT
jgi:hypothetical protein